MLGPHRGYNAADGYLIFANRDRQTRLPGPLPPVHLRFVAPSRFDKRRHLHGEDHRLQSPRQSVVLSISKSPGTQAVFDVHGVPFGGIYGNRYEGREIFLATARRMKGRTKLSENGEVLLATWGPNPEDPARANSWSIRPQQNRKKLDAGIGLTQGVVPPRCGGPPRRNRGASSSPRIDASGRRSSGRSPGGQPGHEGHGRSWVSVEQVDELIPVKPSNCHRCGHPLTGDDPHPQRHQEVVIPPFCDAEVIEYQRSHPAKALTATGGPRQGEV